MKKEIITDLIEDNRFKEAIDLLKKEAKDTYLYNQVILLSASYEDYLKLEITGTEDYSVRSQRRAQLVNGLLHVVDKVAELKPPTAPIMMPKIKRPNIVVPTIELPKINLPTIGIKHVKIVGFSLTIALLLLFLFYFTKNIDRFSPEPARKEASKIVDVAVPTTAFSGRLVRFDMQVVKNATLDFGNGIAKVTTNDKGEYTVNLPSNIGNTIELSIFEDNKLVMSRQVMVNDKVLSLLKIY